MAVPRRMPDMRGGFFVGLDVHTDSGTRDVHTITPSYTMFRQAGAPRADASPPSPQPAVN
jgi:cytochrome c oxidase assembly protein Cox11